MAINCQEIVNWLKTWFTPKDEDYNYDLTVSDYNPVIDSTVTVGVNVTDGNGEIVNNHSFKLWINDDSYETLTTNNDGYASYTFTCSDWGIVRFTAETKNTTVIRVNGWKEITLTNGTLWVNGAERICEAHFSKSGVSFGTANSWTWVATEAEIANYPPKSSASDISQHYVSCSSEPVIARIFPTGSIQALCRNANQTQSVTFSTMWHY